jgi:glutamate-1-semialdehyde 2,1-aminomutase
MSRVSPSGPIYQAGTLSGNPLAMAAGLAVLRTIERDPDIYERLESLGAILEDALTKIIASRGLPCRLARIGSMWTLFFSDRTVHSWSDAARCDTSRFATFFQQMLAQGVLLAPSQFEANFISAAHTPDDIEATAQAAETALERACA